MFAGFVRSFCAQLGCQLVNVHRHGRRQGCLSASQSIVQAHQSTMVLVNAFGTKWLLANSSAKYARRILFPISLHAELPRALARDLIHVFAIVIFWTETRNPAENPKNPMALHIATRAFDFARTVQRRFAQSSLPERINTHAHTPLKYFVLESLEKNLSCFTSD